jgi:hypothetical protein
MGGASTARAVAAPVRARIVLAACVAAWPAGAAAAAHAGTSLHATTTLQPQSVRFGDSVTAEVEVDYDAGTIDPASIHLQPRFAPYAPSSPPVVEHVRRGVVRYRYALLCLNEGCLPAGARRVLRLPRLTVSAVASGRTVTAITIRPTVAIVTRLTAAQRDGRIRFHFPSTPPRVRYAIAPGALAAVLIAFAALAAAAGLALLTRELMGQRARARTRRLSPIELAIAYVRDSTRRAEDDRRRALELLSEAAGGEVARDAADRAWSKQPPTAAGAAELADRAGGAR